MWFTQVVHAGGHAGGFAGGSRRWLGGRGLILSSCVPAVNCFERTALQLEKSPASVSSTDMTSSARFGRLERIVVLLLALMTRLGVSAVNPCLDPDNADYRCAADGVSYVLLNECGITDDDMDDLASCVDAAGRQEVSILRLSWNNFTTLPEDIFEGFTTLDHLTMSFNDFTTLPEGIFRGLTGLKKLDLDHSGLTLLPEDIFQCLPALDHLNLSNTSLTTLPEGIFRNLTALSWLYLVENSLECLPATTLEEADPNSFSIYADGIHVDSYGTECGCFIPGVTDNVCGNETCTPGPGGYFCGAESATAVECPVPAEIPKTGGSTENWGAIVGGVVGGMLLLVAVTWRVGCLTGRCCRRSGK